MLTKYAVLAAASAVAVTAAVPAQAAVFDFANTGMSSMKVDGITVSATAWSVANYSAGATRPTLATLGVYQGSQYGLGVTSGGTADGAAQGPNQHAVDNVGTYEFIALYFDKAVSLTGMKLNAFKVLNGQASADTDDWVSYAGFTGTPPTTIDGIQAAMNTLWPTLLTNGRDGADGVISSQLTGKVANVWVVGAARSTVTAERNDGFKLAAVTAVASPAPSVPEPATWAMMMVGFGMAGAAVRRRRVTMALA